MNHQHRAEFWHIDEHDPLGDKAKSQNGKKHDSNGNVLSLFHQFVAEKGWGVVRGAILETDWCAN